MKQLTEQEAKEKLWRIATGDYLPNDIFGPIGYLEPVTDEEKKEPVTEQFPIYDFNKVYGTEGRKAWLVSQEFDATLEEVSKKFPSVSDEVLVYTQEIADFFKEKIKQCQTRGEIPGIIELFRELREEKFSREKFEELKARFTKEPDVPTEGRRV